MPKPKKINISISTYYRLGKPRPRVLKKIRGGKTFVVEERRSGTDRRKRQTLPMAGLFQRVTPGAHGVVDYAKQQRSGTDRRKK
jgi:hypothetical protein